MDLSGTNLVIQGDNEHILSSVYTPQYLRKLSTVWLTNIL